MSRSILFLLLLISPCVLLAKGKKKVVVVPPSVEAMSASIRLDSPALWVQGEPFVCLYGLSGLSLHPEQAEIADSACFVPGSVWTFDSMVSEEDWMGQQLMQLRFLSPDGRPFRFDTGKPISAMTDTTYHPVLDGLFPMAVVLQADSLFRARTLYLNVNDGRISYAQECLSDTAFVPLKYVEVRVDSVGYGSVTGPLRVWFSSGEMRGSFDTSLPDSRESLTSSPIQRFLSFGNLRDEYPNITDQAWALLQRSEVMRDMTMEEVRLSLGRPLRFERVTTRAGLVECWFYPHSRVLEFLDGRLLRVGRALSD